MCVGVRACTCVSKSLTSVCHRELKALRLESKHCSKYKREAEEQEQSGAHTVKQRGLNATEAEQANTGERREERGGRLSGCDTQPRQELRN